MTELKTYEDLKENVGKKITCVIDGVQVDDCLISIEDTKIFLLQNEKDGNSPKDTKGYKYGWIVESSDTFSDTYIKLSNVYLLDIPKENISSYHIEENLEPINKKPAWCDLLDGSNAILCYVSDYSITGAKENTNMMYVYAFDVYRDYPFFVFNQDISMGDELDKDNLTDYNYYKYAEPVLKEETEIKSTQEKSQEIHDLLSKMDNDKLDKLLEALKQL